MTRKVKMIFGETRMEVKDNSKQLSRRGNRAVMLAGAMLFLSQPSEAGFFPGNGTGKPLRDEVTHIDPARVATELRGAVKDDQGKPLEKALVRLLNTAHESVTGKDGHFLLRSVTPGVYTVSVTANGYAAQTQRLEIGETQEELVFSLTPSVLSLPDVVVTAAKAEQSGRLLPVAFTRIDARRVNELRLWNSRDLTAVVPNLYSGNPGDGRNVTSIRGITSTSYDPAVTTYIDGVAQFNLDTYIPQLFDVERIEVLRGPQGTLYGRNAMGGVINIISKQPVNGTSGYAEAGAGNYGQQRYTAGIRTTLVKDHLFAGAAGLFEKTDGYYSNDFNNTNFDRQRSAAGSYWLKYLSGKRWKADLNVKHLATRNHGAFPLAGSFADALADPFKVNQDAVTELVDNTLNGSLSFSYLLPGVNLVSQTAYQSNYRYYKSPIDGDFSPIDGISIINNYGRDFNRVEAFTQEFRASGSNPDARLGWTAGLFLFTQRSPNKQATHFGEDAAMVGSPDINYAVVNTNTFRNTGGALFAQADYKLSPLFTLTAGLRADRQWSKARILGEYLPDGSPEPVFETQPDTSASRSYTALSPKLGLTWHPGAASVVYMNYARGYRTGGLTQLASDPSQPPLYGYDPEYSDNLELGTKHSVWNNRLQLDLNVFYGIVTDVQVPTLVLPDALTITRNAGRLETMGIEASVEALPAKGLSVSYNFGYTHARYTKLEMSKDGNAVDLSGNRQVYTPDMTSMLAMQYAFPLDKKSGLSLIVRGEWLAIGQTYFDFANQLRQSPYQLFNTRAGLSLRQLELMCWMRNIGDKRYVSYAYEFGAAHLGDPRTIGVTLRAGF